MEFQDYILNEKVSDLPKELQDKYWKIIHNFNSWKKSRDHKKQIQLQTQMSQFRDVLKKYGALDQKSMTAWDEKMSMVFGKTDVPDIKKRTPKTEEPIKNEIPEEPEQNDSDFERIEIDQEFVQKAFDKFNTKYFNGVLKPITLEIVSGNSDHCGCFRSRTNFSNKCIEPVSIILSENDCNVSFSSFRNTFVHEMLHYYVHCYMPLDPDPNTNNQLWETALKYAMMDKKNKCWSILEVSNAYSHGKRWLKLAKDLNKKYPELTITRNTFINPGETRADGGNQLELVNKIKNASLYKITSHYRLNQFSTTGEIVTYKILSDESAKVYNNFIEHNPITEDLFLKLHDKWNSFDLFGCGFDKITHVDIEKAPIVKPQAAIEFRIGNFSPDTSFLSKSDKMLKQMKQAKLFGSFNKLGTIVMKNTNESLNINNIDYFDDFSTWIDKNNIITEKSFAKGKKFSKQELLELGLDDDDIDALESGEFDFETTTI